jgi:hypothetical protein
MENLRHRNFLHKLCDLWLVAIFVAILEMHQILPQVHQGGSKLGLLPYLAHTLDKMPIFSTAYVWNILQASVNKGVKKSFHQKKIEKLHCNDTLSEKIQFQKQKVIKKVSLHK